MQLPQNIGVALPKGLSKRVNVQLQLLLNAMQWPWQCLHQCALQLSPAPQQVLHRDPAPCSWTQTFLPRLAIRGALTALAMQGHLPGRACFWQAPDRGLLASISSV